MSWSNEMNEGLWGTVGLFHFSFVWTVGLISTIFLVTWGVTFRDVILINLEICLERVSCFPLFLVVASS